MFSRPSLSERPLSRPCLNASRTPWPFGGSAAWDRTGQDAWPVEDPAAGPGLGRIAADLAEDEGVREAARVAPSMLESGE
jgi:hypothetical protein